MPQQIRIRKATLTTMLIVVFSLAAALIAPAATAATVAQTSPTGQCSQVLPLAQKNISALCSALGAEEVCYGNSTVDVQYQDSANADQVKFAAVGDLAPVKVLKSITTMPLNLDKHEWGVALMRIRSNDLAGTSAGQVVTMVLYGDVNINDLSGSASGSASSSSSAASGPASSATFDVQSATADASAAPVCSGTITAPTFLRIAPKPDGDTIQRLSGSTPVTVRRRVDDNSWVFVQTQDASGWVLGNRVNATCDLNSLPTTDPTLPVALPGLNAFYFSTGVGTQGKCQDVPAGSIMLQSPSHQKVTFRANGVDFTMGSTVLLTAQANQKLTAYVLDGQLTADVNGVKQTATTGQMLTVPMGDPPGGKGGEPGLEPGGPPSGPTKSDLSNSDRAAACALAKSAGLDNPCTIRLPIPTKIVPTTAPAVDTPIPAAPTVCPDPQDQRYLLPCGPICPAGQLRSNENTCVCPQNCAAGMKNVAHNGQCTCMSTALVCNAAGVCGR